jgi:arylsulfatase A-like enzyme
LGIFDSSVVVLTSDHGEYFGEHQLVAHSKDVYQEALRVPLLVKAPGQQRRGRVVDTPASLVDLPWLIL